MFLGHRGADAVEFRAVELDEAVAAMAVEVVVAGIAVLVLVHAPRAERHFADQARLDQFGKRAINRGPAEPPRGQERAKVLEQFLGVEMIVVAEHLLDDLPSLRGQPLAAAFQTGGNVRPAGPAFAPGQASSLGMRRS